MPSSTPFAPGAGGHAGDAAEYAVEFVRGREAAHIGDERHCRSVVGEHGLDALDLRLDYLV